MGHHKRNRETVSQRQLARSLAWKYSFRDQDKAETIWTCDTTQGVYEGLTETYPGVNVSLYSEEPGLVLSDSRLGGAWQR